MKVKYIVSIFLLFISGTFIAQTLTIISWNIQTFGQSKSDETIQAIARLINHADIVLIQEVVAKHPGGAQAVGRLNEVLDRMGSKWESRISDPTFDESPNKRERYAVLWKPSKVEIVGRHRLWSEKKHYFVREPHLLQFRIKSSGSLFHLVNYHARVHSDRPEEEIVHFIDLPTFLKTDRIIIAGDFNAPESHPVFDLIYRMGYQPALRNTPTTLKRQCVDGVYTNHPIDNIYYPTQYVSLVSAGLIDFVGDCDQLMEARQISDHLGVEFKFVWKEP